MTQACIALLLATTLAAPAGEPAATTAAPVTASEAAPGAAPAPVATPAPASVATPAPTPAPTVTLAPAPVATPAPEPAPVSTVTLVPAPAPIVAPPPPRVDPERIRAQRSADGLVITGAVTAGLGAASLVLVAWPAHALYRRSLERAESARWVTSQDRFLDDARHRRAVMLTSAGLGVGLAAVGTVILATGLSRRARLRNSSAATLSVAPAVGGGTYGVGASMRF